MRMFNWLKRKSVSSSSVLAEFISLGKAKWFNPDYQGSAVEGYCKNIVAYYCIKRISESVADIPYMLSVNGKEVEKHPILSLLKKPNPMQTYKTFMRVAVMHRLISGNTYIHANVASTKKIMEMTLMRPDRVRIDVTSSGMPRMYVYTVGGNVYEYPIDPIEWTSEVLQIKEPNPLCDLYGLSPISAASMSIAQHNESSEWNKKLLENSARPPGVLVMKDRTDSAPSLSPEQLKKIRDDINDKFAGYKNAGKIPVLNFEMEWRSMGLSPTDMDWINGKNTTARDICLAFGVPPQLLGQPEGSTFNNVAEAKLAFYEETIIPLTQNMYSEMAQFITAHTGQEVEIEPDLDKVSALSLRRETARTSARADVEAGVITINEARAESGYDPVPGGDEIFVPAAKLPLNFDTSNMSKQQFIGWLKAQGYDGTFSQKIAETAYGNSAGN
jgi:HK97 family phage portal protein